MSTNEFAIARAIVATLCPARGALPEGNTLGIAQQIDEKMGRPMPRREQLKQGLQVSEHLPALRLYGARFTSLAVDRREAFFNARLADSSETFRQVATPFKQIVQLCYFGNEVTWAAIGYDGPWVPRPRVLGTDSLFVSDRSLPHDHGVFRDRRGPRRTPGRSRRRVVECLRTRVPRPHWWSEPRQGFFPRGDSRPRIFAS